jgi:hypothetical protein
MKPNFSHLFFWQTLCSLCFAFFFVLQATASPSPGMATSALVSPHLGLFRSPRGFEVSANGSGWSLEEPPKGNKTVTTVYQSPIAKDAEMTIRVDQLKAQSKELTVEKYAQRWIKEYPRYGFDVMNSQPFQLKNQKGYVLDLINRDTAKQLRQVLFLKNKTAVILTCRDKISDFQNSIRGCNQIIRSFNWTE